jgi:hypothetical protein
MLCIAGQAGAWLERQEGAPRRRSASRGLAGDDGAAGWPGATEGNPRPALRWPSARVPKRPGLLRPIPKTSMRFLLQAYSELSNKRGISQMTRVNRDLPWSRTVERTNCHAFQCTYCRHFGCGRNRDVGGAISYIHIHRDRARRTSSDFCVRVRDQPDGRSQRHSVGLMSKCTST